MFKLDITSFSYKKGLPIPDPQDPNAEHGGGFIFDCRSVINPGRDPILKNFTGRDPEIKNYLTNRPDVEEFFGLTKKLVENAIKNYKERGFGYLSVSYGCTGGKHRSVYFAERLGEEFDLLKDMEINLFHREQE